MTPTPPKRRRGAPKGNLNALKHGQYSEQQHAVALAIRALGQTVDIFNRAQLRQARERRRFAQALRHCADLIDALPTGGTIPDLQKFLIPKVLETFEKNKT